MQCIHPIGIKDQKYLVPCGRCAACLQRKRSDWVVRLQQELKCSENALFITLTYEDRYVPTTGEHDTLSRIDVQKFMKRLRKRCEKGIKYYLVGEYGSKTQRPHYHAIMFNVMPLDKTKQPQDVITDSWMIIRSDNKRVPIGHVHFGTVTGASMSYTAKYILQNWRKYLEKERPFSLMSKGIGIDYVKTNYRYHENNIEHMHMVNEGGSKTALPRYYKDKLYSKREKKIYEIRCRNKAKENFIKKQDHYEAKHDKKYYKQVLEANRDFERQVEKIKKKDKL
jgi:hypothetical protein